MPSTLTMFVPVRAFLKVNVAVRPFEPQAEGPAHKRLVPALDFHQASECSKEIGACFGLSSFGQIDQYQRAVKADLSGPSARDLRLGRNWLHSWNCWISDEPGAFRIRVPGNFQPAFG